MRAAIISAKRRYQERPVRVPAKRSTVVRSPDSSGRFKPSRSRSARSRFWGRYSSANRLICIDEADEQVRYSARSVRAQKKRPGISAADYGKLIGVSGLTVYIWESGKSRPRQAHLPVR